MGSAYSLRATYLTSNIDTMDVIQQKLEQLQEIQSQKESVEKNLQELTTVLRYKNTFSSIKFVGIGPNANGQIVITPEMIEPICNILTTQYTTLREKLIQKAEKIIGPIDPTELVPNENETAPLNQQ